MEINCILSKNILSMSINVLVAHKEGGFSLFRLLSGFVSGLFQPVLACYSLFRVVPRFTRDDVTECLTCKFTINRLHEDVVRRWANCITKQDSFHLKMRQVLQNRVTFTTKSVRYYQVWQFLSVQKANERNGDDQYIFAVDSLIHP